MPAQTVKSTATISEMMMIAVFIRFLAFDLVQAMEILPVFNAD